MKDNYKVGIIGATGMVGQRFITLPPMVYNRSACSISEKCRQGL